MATGTVVFQTSAIASPPSGLAVMADAVNDTDHGAGTAQYIKIMDGATGGTVKAGVSALGLAVDSRQKQGEGFFGSIFTAAVTNGTLVAAPSSGTYTRVWDIVVSGSAAGSVFVELGNGTPFAPLFLAAYGGLSFSSAKGVRTNGTSHDILFNCAAGTWGVSVNYSLET